MADKNHWKSRSVVEHTSRASETNRQLPKTTDRWDIWDEALSSLGKAWAKDKYNYTGMAGAYSKGSAIA